MFGSLCTVLLAIHVIYFMCHIVQSVFEVSAIDLPHFFPVTAWARSAKASLRLNLASSMTPIHMLAVMFGCPTDSMGSLLPASASEEKCADHCRNVDPSLSPVVTAWHLMVEMTLEYERAGVEEMTE